MIRSLSAAALLAASLAASASAQGAACASNPDLDGKSFALWVTDKTNPDETPCAAMLSAASCAVDGGSDARVYKSADGSRAALLRVAADGAISVAIQFADANGLTGIASLATYPYRRVAFKGIGADAVTMFDESSRAIKTIGNVMLIPADALTENGRAMCPAR